MADDPQNIDIQVEADVSQADSANKLLVRGVGTLIEAYAQLEAKLKSVNSLGVVAATAQAKDMALQASKLRATLKDISNDSAVNVLKVEEATNKVLMERQKIYARIREEGASTGHNTAAYRGALGAIGAGSPTDEAGRKAWLAKTLEETRMFEQQRIAIAADAAAKQEAINERVISNYERMDAAAVDRQIARRERLALVESKRNAAKIADDERAYANWERLDAGAVDRQIAREDRLKASEAKRSAAKIADDDRAYSNWERLDAAAYDRQLARDARLAAADAKRNAARSPEALNGHIGQQFEYQSARANYNGGANMVGGQVQMLAGYAAIGGVLGAFSGGVKSSIELEAALKELQAITASTNTEMVSLQKTIFEVGNTTKFSTKEIAEAATVLGQAGYSASQIESTLPAIAKLATGAGANMKDAVAAVTSVLSVFNMSMDQAMTVSNQMAAALNLTKLDFAGLSSGIQYASTAAMASNVSFEEMTAALGAMANAGIKGSQAGSGLRNILVQLDNPSTKFLTSLKGMGLSAEDVSLKTHSLADVMSLLKEKGFQATNAMHDFGMRAGGAYGALSNQLDTFIKLQNSLSDTTAASDAAKIQMQSMEAQTQRLTNAFTKFVTIAGAPFLSMVKSMTGGLATLLTSTTRLAPVFQVLATMFASLVASSILIWLSRLTIGFLGLSPIVSALGIQNIITATSFMGLEGGITAATVGIEALTAAMMANPVLLLAAGLAIATTAFFGFSAAQATASAKVDEAKTAVDEARAKTADYQSKVQEISNYIEILTARHASLATQVNGAKNEAITAASKFGAWGLVMDSTSGKVDILIGRLRTLRGEMASDAVASLNAERAALLTKQKAINTNNAPRVRDGQLSADALSSSNVIDARTKALLQRYSSGGQLSAAESQELQSNIRKVQGKLPTSGWGGNQRGNAQGVLDGLNSPDAAQLQSISAELKTNTQGLGVATAASIPAGLAVQADVDGLSGWYADQKAKNDKITDPAQKKAAALDLERRAGVGFNQLNANITAQATAALKDPVVRAGMESLAQQNGTTAMAEMVKQMKSGSPGYAQAAIHANTPVASQDPLYLKARSQRLAADAKNTKDMAARRKILEEKLSVDMNYWDTQHPNADPEVRDAAMEEMKAGGESHIQTATRAHGGAPSLNQQDLNADAALRAADDHTDTAAGLASSGDDITGVLKATFDEYAKARDMAVAAIKRRKPGVEGIREAEAIIKKYDDAASKAALEILSAQMRGAADRDAKITARGQAVIDARRLGVAMLSNYSGMRNLSDTQRYLGGRENHNIDVAQARVVTQSASMANDSAQGNVWNLQAVYSKNGSKENLAALAKARLEADATAKGLEKATLAEKELVGEAKNFATVNEAIKGAWDTFADKMKLAEPIMSQIADGMEHTFETIHSSMGTLVTSVLTGTATMKQAFKSFAVSVLQSLMDMIAKIIANKLLMWGFQMVGAWLGGGTGGDNANVGVPMVGHAQGGEVTGGIPGRDSVPANLMPGEVIMTKSAVDMAGKDNLARMNAAGNRSIDRMGTLAGAMDMKKPPMTNVWVTLPGQQPTMGKDDVLVAVAADILAGGQTKRLIKAVAMGQA